ncbi:hypothetical protein [Histophilus somni]|uniref:hypothetical protein n=1 Tax=Histophilus somni TaxID=731 RepID=UPI0018EB83A6|nr:hypothetical protein [Histophilus somni]QQF78974.1 hypothetical protein JFL53_01175 [Histophilus somni]
MDKGALKLTENSATLESTKDVKATGLSTIGKDENNALVFKKGTGNTAELKVGGSALTFTKAVRVQLLARLRLQVLQPSKVQSTN